MKIQLLIVTTTVVLAAVPPAFGQTITSPAAPKTIVPWEDYATSVLRDAWDMNQRTDIGWFTWGVDQPVSNLSAKRITTDEFGNTTFSAIPATSDPSLSLLDTAAPGKAQVGKVGSLFPIATNKYTRLLIKMRLGSEIKPAQFPAIGTVPVMQLYWSRDTIYFDQTTRPTGGTYLLVDAVGNQVGIPFTPQGGNTNFTMEGGHYVIYSIPVGDIAAMQALNSNIAKWKNINANNPAVDVNWGAAGVTADSLRFKPVNLTASFSGSIDIDWARLVAPAADSPEPVTWTGGGTYDIVISTATDCGASNGDYAVMAYSKTSGFQFNPQSLPNGVYYVGLRDHLDANNPSDTPSSRQIRACSSSAGGSYTVLDYPAFDFTSPNPTGSSDDFATTFLNNPWDFAAANDIDTFANLASLNWFTVPAERRDGTPLGNVPLMFGANIQAPPGAVGDPYFFPLHWTARGFTTRIDADRYRLFTLDMGIDRARSLVDGSILRLIWHIAGETFVGADGSNLDAMTVTSDIPLFHLHKGAQSIDSDSANFQLDRVQVDMADRARLPLEPSSDGSLSLTGWSNAMQHCGALGCNLQRIEPFDRIGIDEFRIDPHEFSSPTQFFVGTAKLAAHERTGADFTISWTGTLPAKPTAGVYADPASWKVRLYAVRTKPESSQGAGDASPMTPATKTCTSGIGVDSFQITASGSEPSLASGAYVWHTNQTPGLVSGGLYFICAGLIMPGQGTPITFNLSQWPVVYAPGAITTALPRLYVNQSVVHMVTTPQGGHTPPQAINITQIGGQTPVGWLVDVCPSAGACTGSVPAIQLSATSGSGSGSFTVELVPGQTPPSSALVRIRELSSGSTANTPQYVQLLSQVVQPAQTQAPFGQLELPVQGAVGVQGALGVGGWVLDDVGVTSLRVYRNCLPPFEAAACQGGVIPGYPQALVVYVGDGIFLAGARPDVEAQFPQYPQANRAGFGMFILSNMLPRTTGPFQPNGGQGPLTIYAVAYDADGHATLLGRSWNGAHDPTTVDMDNDSIAKPFGVIDTPTQGGDASGNAYLNFGWAVTPDDGTGIEIPINQQANPSMFVFIDGAPVGVVTYNGCRGNVGTPPPPAIFCNDDVSNIFGNVSPQPPLTTRTSNPSRYRNLNAGRGPIGYFVVDTTVYSNGLHSIGWGVYDNRGRVEGIGSRLMTVANQSSSIHALNNATQINPELGRRVTELAALGPMRDPVGVKLGPAQNDGFSRAPSRAGVVQVQARDMQRVELSLPSTLSGSSWQGYAVQGGRLRTLPIGASLDPSGRFYWQPVAGFYGGYDFLFIRDSVGGTRETVPVHVSLEPSFRAPASVGLASTPLSASFGRSSGSKDR